MEFTAFSNNSKKGMKKIFLISVAFLTGLYAHAQSYPTNEKASSVDATGAKRLVVHAYDGELSFGEAVAKTLKSSTTYEFAPNGNLSSVTTQNGTRTYEYNTAGQLVKVSYPNGAIYNYTYAGGKLTTVDLLSASGELNRKWKRSYSGTQCIEHEYNSDGREVATYTYTNGLLTKREIGMQTRTYTYNANKQVIKITSNEVLITTTGTFTYNTKGLLKQVHSAGDDYNFTYSYDTKGNWITQNQVKNDGEEVEIQKREYTYY